MSETGPEANETRNPSPLIFGPPRVMQDTPKPPGYYVEQHYGWNRDNKVTTFSSHFSNYIHSNQDEVLVIPLPCNHDLTSELNTEGFYFKICERCYATVDESRSSLRLPTLPMVLTFTPQSRLHISSARSDRLRLSIHCTCEGAAHHVNRVQPIKPKKQKSIKIILL